MLANKPQISMVALGVTSTLSILTSLNQVDAQTNENSAKIVASSSNSTSLTASRSMLEKALLGIIQRLLQNHILSLS
jgi:hypothetical protein